MGKKGNKKVKEKVQKNEKSSKKDKKEKKNKVGEEKTLTSSKKSEQKKSKKKDQLLTQKEIEKATKKAKKKDKKSGKKKDAMRTPENIELTGDTSVMLGVMLERASDMEKGGDRFFDTPIGVIRMRVSVSEGGSIRITWQKDGIQVAKSVLMSMFSGNKKAKSEKKDKKKKKDGKKEDDLLITRKQMDSKYLVSDVLDSLASQGFSSKKQVKKMAKLFKKKKTTGDSVIAAMTVVFGRLEAADFFATFEGFDKF